MLNGKKVVSGSSRVQRRKDAEKTVREILRDVVDTIILTDDCSKDV